MWESSTLDEAARVEQLVHMREKLKLDELEPDVHAPMAPRGEDNALANPFPGLVGKHSGDIARDFAAAAAKAVPGRRKDAAARQNQRKKTKEAANL